MTCPHCNAKITPEQVRTLWGSYTGSKQTPHAGPGRPRKMIGEIMRAAAILVNHGLPASFEEPGCIEVQTQLGVKRFGVLGALIEGEHYPHGAVVLSLARTSTDIAGAIEKWCTGANVPRSPFNPG